MSYVLPLFFSFICVHSIKKYKILFEVVPPFHFLFNFVSPVTLHSKFDLWAKNTNNLYPTFPLGFFLSLFLLLFFCFCHSVVLYMIHISFFLHSISDCNFRLTCLFLFFFFQSRYNILWNFCISLNWIWERWAHIRFTFGWLEIICHFWTQKINFRIHTLRLETPLWVTTSQHLFSKLQVTMSCNPSLLL